jgi:MFS transporter, ACS family, DAL5 transporter family protein
VSVQLGSVGAAFIYRTDDAPKYRRGNRNLIIINVVVILFFIATKFYYVARNKSRDKKWKAMSAEEQNDYLQNTSDRGSRRLNFRFAH